MAADHFHDLAVAHLRKALAAPFLGAAIPNTPKLAQPLNHRPRNVGVAVDRGGVDLSVGELADRGHGRLDSCTLALGQLGVRKE